MGSRPVRIPAVGLALLAIAFGLNIVFRSAYGQRSAYVHVRWAEHVDSATRQAVEIGYGLTPLEVLADRTWRYLLTDVSADNIRRLIANPAVEDTHYLDRTRFRVDRTAVRGGYATRRPAWLAAMLELLIPALAALGAIVLAVAPFSAWNARRTNQVLDGEHDAGRVAGTGASHTAAVSAAPERQSTRLWLLAAVGCAVPILLALCVTMWRAPFPISETVALMEDAGVLDDTPLSIDSPTLRSFFDPSIRWWYRPFYHLTWHSLWHLTGSIATSLTLFKLLEVGAVATLVLLFIYQLRPRTFTEFAAASFAVSVLIGMPGFRENLEVPMLYTLVGMPAILLVWILVEREPRGWRGPVVVALLIVAAGFKEQGLIIAPLVVMAWWLGAPGATRGTTISVVAATVAYLVFRLSTSGAWSPFEQDVGLGFTMIPAAEASARFGNAPLPMYAYNAASTVSNVLFSEPTSGRFAIVSSLVRGDAAPWQINHLLSSIALTGLILLRGFQAWRRNAGLPWSQESRVFAAAIVTVAACGALGFNYTRDRLGGMGAVFYAMAAYFAMRAACDRMSRAAGGRFAAGCAGLLLLAGAWQLRAIGTVEGEHLRATKVRREWMVDLHQERVEKADKPRYLRILDAMADQGMSPRGAPATPYPAWAVPWLRER